MNRAQDNDPGDISPAGSLQLHCKQEIAGSNPVSPIDDGKGVRSVWSGSFFCWIEGGLKDRVKIFTLNQLLLYCEIYGEGSSPSPFHLLPEVRLK